MIRKTKFITLKRYKQMSAIRNVEFIPWDEKFVWIISTYNIDYIYNPNEEVCETPI